MDSTHTAPNADTLHAKAAALLDAGRINAARPLLAAARVLSGNSVTALTLSARLAAAEGDWPRALSELDTAIEAEPDHADLWKYRAEARHRGGDVEGAARDAAEAVCLAPSDARAKALLGAALLDLGLPPQAAACLGEAVSAAPAETIYREALAAALERMGDAEGALSVLLAGIDAAPGSLSTRNAAILLCMRRRDFLKAVALADAARASGVADAATFGMKGHALSSLGRHDAAALAYQDALKLDPENAHMQHMVAASAALPDARRAPEDFIRTVFDSHADRFDLDLISQRYVVPGVIRSIAAKHPVIAAGQQLGPVLDLGCGTGLAALAISDLPLGPITGIDLSPRMLRHAEAKQLYAALREGDIIRELRMLEQTWPLIMAADVACYFGALEELLAAVYQRLQPGGWFVFSAEEMLPEHAGAVPGNGNWVLGCQGRYAHASHYVHEAVCAAGFRVLRFDRPAIRQEAGIDVPGLLLTVERMAAC